jgi:hypothetical protein
MNYIKYKSYSGDWFKIPKDTAERDINDYRKALTHGDEKVMIMFESGMTGWKYDDQNVL